MTKHDRVDPAERDDDVVGLGLMESVEGTARCIAGDNDCVETGRDARRRRN